MSRIVIYPVFNASYYAFYIQGLVEMFGASSIRYSAREFPKLPPEWLSFIYRENGKDHHIAIDSYDGQITLEQYELMDWPEVFAKANLRSWLVFKEHLHRCIAIGPSFGVQVWTPARSMWLSLRNYRPSIHGVKEDAREHFGNYFRQYKYRLSLEHFVPGASDDKYIFCMSSLWDDNQAPRTNQHRATFMRYSKTLDGVPFEGGFSPSKHPERDTGYEDLIVPKRYPYTEWLEKTRRSTLVFNTPAVWQCHGWKLGEYLALGKAIISTPLVNDLPAELVHGEHVHFVEGTAESIGDAVQRILKDSDYRKRLEVNSRAYYDSHLAPRRVIERVLQRIPR